jgi:hypothetical protein
MERRQMADGEISVGLNPSAVQTGAAAAADAIKKMEGSVAKATERIDSLLQGMASNAESSGKKMSKSFQQAVVSLASAQTRLEQAKVKLATVQEGAAGRMLQSEVVAQGNLAVERQAGRNTTRRSKRQIQVDDNRADNAKMIIDHRNTERIKTNDTIEGNRARRSEEKKTAAIIKKYEDEQLQRSNQWVRLGKSAKEAGLSPSQFFTQSLNRGIGTSNLMAQMNATGKAGGSGTSVWQAAMNRAIYQSNAGSNAGTAGLLAAGQPEAAAGGKGGGIGGIFRRLLGGGGGGIAGSLVGGFASGIGIGVGGYALARLGSAAIEAVKTATAYERQMVAARNLAGSQDQLNKLLEVYNKASGGAVSKTDQLAAVTRLLATGFAKTAGEVQRFSRGSRGASIALGRPQEQVTQEIQLAISNTSVKRLDNIGLGIKEVNDRIEQLRKSNVGWRRETAFSEAVIGLLDEKYGNLSDTLEGQKSGLEKLATAWDDLTLAQGKNFNSPVNKAARAIAGAVQSVADNPWGSNFENNFGSGYGRVLRQNSVVDRFAAGIHGYGNVAGYNAQQALDAGEFPSGTSGLGFHGSYTGPSKIITSSAGSENAEKILDTKRQGYDQLMSLEKDVNKQRLDEVQNYERSVASMEKNYQKSMLREEQDFTRQRARGLRDYEKQIVGIMKDAQERDAQINEDLGKSIAKATEQSNKQLAKSEKDFQEQEEKASKQHRLSMMKAAGQLDAIAILEERQQYKLDKAERQKQHAEDIKDAKDNLADQIKEAKEAAQERIDDAHKADAKRLADMAADRKQQLEDEDTDRGISLARAKEDHDDEIAEAARVHDEKMKQITAEYEDRKKQLTDALESDLAALGVYIAGYTDKVEKKDKVITDFFDKFVDAIEEMNRRQAKIPMGDNSGNPVGPTIPQFASGGYVGRSGIAMLHGGEYVMPRSMVQAASGMNNYNSNSRTVQIQQGAISIFTTPGMEHMVGDLVEEKMIELYGTV